MKSVFNRAAGNCALPKTASRRPERRRAAIRWVVAAGAVAAVVLAVGRAIRPEAGVSQADIELARRVTAWKSPTAFLLDRPLAGLPSSAPVPGRSPDGSPLRVLDPGGPLGPPVPPTRRTRI